MCRSIFSCSPQNSSGWKHVNNSWNMLKLWFKDSEKLKSWDVRRAPGSKGIARSLFCSSMANLGSKDVAEITLPTITWFDEWYERSWQNWNNAEKTEAGQWFEGRSCVKCEIRNSEFLRVRRDFHWTSVNTVDKWIRAEGADSWQRQKQHTL